jgi:hypothetical protein
MLEIRRPLPALRRDDRAAQPADLHDLRFRALLGEAGWSRLPQAVRDRFSKRLRPGWP